MYYRHLAVAAAFLGLATLSSHATITMTLQAGQFSTQSANTAVAEGTLFQLINLGADGVFNPISLADGNISQTGQWVSGDDSLITASYLGGSDYATLGGFDLIPGNTPPLPGTISRQFVFNVGELATGTKVGIRWFPGLTAANYYLPGSITLAGNQSYGQFTRQNDAVATGALYDGAVNGGKLWVVPTDNTSAYDLDPLITTVVGGPEAASLGQASLTVTPAPEPATLGLALLGGMGLLGLRRRRS